MDIQERYQTEFPRPCGISIALATGHDRGTIERALLAARDTNAKEVEPLGREVFVAALGIREWDAVSLTGSRTTAAVAAVAPSGTPTGTALLDDVTLSNAGVREDTAVLVAPATVYGARSVTLSGSNLATRSISPATLRQALLGKVMTVGDTVSLLPRDLVNPKEKKTKNNRVMIQGTCEKCGTKAQVFVSSK